jgi:hypothetical protein
MDVGVVSTRKPQTEHDRVALRSELVVFGLLAVSFVLYPDPLATVVGADAARLVSLAYFGLWLVYAAKLVFTGRLTR